MSVAQIKRATLEPTLDAKGRVVSLDVVMEYLDGRVEKTHRTMNPLEVAALDLFLIRQQKGTRR